MRATCHLCARSRAAASQQQALASIASSSSTGASSSQVDLVGPPDPLTHLRPVYYAPRFTAPAPTTTTRKLHPYSLDEFSTPIPSPRASPRVTSSSTDPGAKAISPKPSLLSALTGLLTNSRRTSKQQFAPTRLEKLRQQFEAEDLAWRLSRRRLDQISHEHWARSNAAFTALREEALQEAEQRAALEALPAAVTAMSMPSGTPNAPLMSAPPESTRTPESATATKTRREDPAVMERFLYDWVNGRGPEFEAYQRVWIPGILGQIRPALRARYRDWRWRFEVWRSGVKTH